MFFIIGFVIVAASVAGGYVAMGGHLAVLWQPFEFVIIFGSAIGAFIIASPKRVMTATIKSLGKLIKGARYKKDDYLELLSMLYTLFKLAKAKGDLALESHVERPEESPIFQNYPKFVGDHHAREFLCDYLRLLTLGAPPPHEVESVMDAELDVHHTETHAVGGALQSMADALPALGIVAAVLGVIKTMGAITEPPEVLGKLIGGALVGTFLGVWLSYGFVGPIASKARQMYEDEDKFLHCIKSALLAHMNGSAPAVSVEFARKVLYLDQRPTFYEVEDAVAELPPVA